MVRGLASGKHWFSPLGFHIHEHQVTGNTLYRALAVNVVRFRTSELVFWRFHVYQKCPFKPVYDVYNILKVSKTPTHLVEIGQHLPQMLFQIFVESSPPLEEPFQIRKAVCSESGSFSILWVSDKVYLAYRGPFPNH